MCAREHQLCASFLWALPAGACLRPCARPGPAQCAGSMPLCGQSEEALLRGFHKPRSPGWFLPLLLFWPRGCWEQGKDARDGQGPVRGTHRWVPGTGGGGLPGACLGPLYRVLPWCHPWEEDVPLMIGVRLTSPLLCPGSPLAAWPGSLAEQVAPEGMGRVVWKWATLPSSLPLLQTVV